ncbi:hypothetical protein G4G28_01005 [Massilia sp. Dwa41.01b]|uniref:hypothetical protein n=1 Tax=unclassified Massilia TaxID=2609279 RepID=UPI0016046879|nr:MULTISPECIES: hypothetical protein [unclassified Massilia]QNA87406.1 hypothetical protein G4G28_01005 [Massilia sp. Dwa41.01b]QNA98312.1 hypothetical protein G4G31_04765 [Massilia sp. Se16.2.3]
MRIIVAAIAAALVQPLVFAALHPDALSAAQSQPNFIGAFAVMTIAVAAAVVLVGGVPIFLVMRKLDWLSWPSLALAGLLAGALPVAALFWPRPLGDYSDGHNWHGVYVDTYIAGQPTTYAWLSYGEEILRFGCHGLVGALVFYGVWRLLGGQTA